MATIGGTRGSVDARSVNLIKKFFDVLPKIMTAYLIIIGGANWANFPCAICINNNNDEKKNKNLAKKAGFRIMTHGGFKLHSLLFCALKPL